MNTQSFPPWRQRLVRSLHLNRSQPQSRYYQVATVDGSGLPKNRTMVFRGFEDANDNLLSITDRRSEKIIDWQKQENKNFELCWYFSKSREQYRVSGRAKLLFASDLPKYTAGEAESSKLIKTWIELSQNAQQAFYLDTPKTPFCDNSEKADIQGSDSNKLSTNIKKTNINNAEVIRNISENFVLVSFIAESVDYLNLRATPHERLLSDKFQSWQERKVYA